MPEGLISLRFWSELSEIDRFQVDYLDRRWTGYKSLLACLRRGLDEDYPVTTPSFWCNEEALNDLKHIFRSATNEPMPLLDKRIAMLQEAGQELIEVRQWHNENARSMLTS